MGRKPKYIKNLTEEEITSLREGYSKGESPIFRRKCHCILQSHAGKTAEELSSFFEIKVYSIRSWLRDWESQGIQGLKLKPGRGRKPKLKTEDPKHVETVKELIKNEPKNIKLILPKIEDKLGVEVSKKTLKRFLKNLNTDGNAFDTA